MTYSSSVDSKTQTANLHQQSSQENSTKKLRSYRQDGFWFFQLAEGAIFGPFDKVYDAIMKDREFEERELSQKETIDLMLQFA